MSTGSADAGAERHDVGGAYWELDAGTNSTLWTATHAVYGLVGALLFLVPFLLAIPIFWMLENAGILALIGLLFGIIAVKVGIWFVVWPSLTAGTGPVALPWSEDVSVWTLVQAVLGWLLALLVAVRFWPAPVLMAGVGLAVGLSVIRLGWTRGEVDAVTGDLSIEGEPVPLDMVSAHRRLGLGSVSLFWVRYDGWPRARRLFLAPTREAAAVDSTLEQAG